MFGVLHEGRIAVGDVSHSKQEVLGGEQATLRV